jgi:hypothetical protein
MTIEDQIHYIENFYKEMEKKYNYQELKRASTDLLMEN